MHNPPGVGVIDRLLGRGGRARRERARRAVGLGRAALVRDDTSLAFAIARDALLSVQDDADLLRLAGDAVQVRDAAAGDLFARAADAPDDLQRVFELGSHLLSAERPQLACVFLERALTFAPFDAVIRSELAIAQARSGNPGEAVQTLALHPCLVDDPGALFEFGWASLLCGDLDAAQGARDGLAGRPSASDLSRKLEYALRRAAVAASSSPPDARDFLFLEHGSVLLSQAAEGGGRYGELTLDTERVGDVLAAGAAVVRALVPRPRRVLAVGDDATELADAVARAVDGERAPLGPGRVPAGVLVAWRAVDLERLGSRLDAPTGEVITFAVSLDWSRGVGRVPDLVGVLARDATVARDGLRVAVPTDAADPDLLRFIDERRQLIVPAGRRVASAYVPDAPLPWI